MSVPVAKPPVGVSVVGLKLHDAPAGSPEHARLTGNVKPLMAVATIPTEAEGADPVMINCVFPNCSEKSTAVTVTVRALLVDAGYGGVPVEPEYTAVILCVPTVSVVLEYVAIPAPLSVTGPPSTVVPS